MASPEASPRPSDAPSKLGAYTVERRLGRGGMATVYLGKDADGLSVALKVMLPQFASEPTFLERFVREVDATRRLEHKNVVRVLGAGEQDGLPYMVTEYVEGGTLETLLEECPKLAAPLALEIGAQLLEGLSAAHAQGIVHRDLKPANLLLTTSGALKIADFGVAKVAGASSLTRTGALFGTPAYMSPEQTQGAHVDHRSDLFSAGVILYELLTGINPHKTEDPSAALLRVQLGVPPIVEVEPSLTPAVEAAVEKLLERDQGDRFQSAQEALQAFLPLVAEARHKHPALLVEGLLDPVGITSRLKSEQAEAFRLRARQLIAESHTLPASLWLHRAALLDPNNEGVQRALQQLGERETLHFGPSANPRVAELEAAVARAPDNVKVLLQLAQLHRLEGNVPKAVACLKRVLRLRPADVYVAAQLSQITGEKFSARESSSSFAQGIDTGGHAASRRQRPLAPGAQPVADARPGLPAGAPMPASLPQGKSPGAITEPSLGVFVPPGSSLPPGTPSAETRSRNPALDAAQSSRGGLIPDPPPLPVSHTPQGPGDLELFWQAWGKKLAILAAAIAVLGWSVQRVGQMVKRASDDTDRATEALRKNLEAPVPVNTEERALEARLTAGMLAADRQLELARAAMVKTDYVAAVEAAGTLVERYPKLPQATEASFLYGKALFLAGNAKEAAPVLSKFVSDHGGSKQYPEALLLSGAALVKLEDGPAALLPLGKLLETLPDSGFALEARLLRGQALALKGDKLLAEVDFKAVLGKSSPADGLHARAQAAIDKLAAR